MPGFTMSEGESSGPRDVAPDLGRIVICVEVPLALEPAGRIRESHPTLDVSVNSGP
jgi:hypothetical protein